MKQLYDDLEDEWIMYKKEFFSIEDFQNRGKVNTSTIDKLRSLDIFEGMPESSQLSLF